MLIVYSAVSVNIAQTDSGNKNFTTSETSDYDLNFSFPPEWEPHEAVWVDWAGFANETRIEIIETLHKNVKIKLLTFSDSLKSLAINMMLDAEIDTSQVEIYYHSVPNYFLRDAGPNVYEIFRKLFPDRKVVQINALPLNWNGGGIHCTTQQIPGLKDDSLLKSTVLEPA